ncbi:hypothetical protein X781_20160 [Mannheimia sp. USDA-ARS-USMARC-1261]|nr:hypothetical protein X781_20160 [Mannheimia sp. USDA-ARS-USMARC-1261]
MTACSYNTSGYFFRFFCNLRHLKMQKVSEIEPLTIYNNS